MKRLVLSVVGLLALFSILRAHSQEATRHLVVHPSLLEIADEGSGLSVGVGVVESTGDRNQVWSVFPIRVSLRSGSERFALSLSGLDLLARRGLSIGRPIAVGGVHRGDLVSIGGNVVVTGTVEGSVWVLGADASVKSGARVDGDVVSLGGKVYAERGALLAGNKQSLPAVRIPFLGFITSRQSAEALQFIIELAGLGFSLFALFLVLHFRGDYMSQQVAVVAGGWKANLLYLFLGVVFAPVLVAFLAASIVGLLLVPVALLALALSTCLGFLGVSVRLGRVFVRGGEDPLKLYGAGLAGLALIRGPGLAGRMLSLLGSEAFVAVGAALKAVGGILLFAAILYGFGCGLSAARQARR
jgi:hypothetical protein